MAKTNSNNRKVLEFSKFDISDIYLLGSYKYNTSNQNLKMHTHKNMMEICFLEKGNQIYCVNNQHYFLQGGDIFLTYPNELHGSGIYPEDKGTLYWLIINLSNKETPFCNFLGEESKAFKNKLLEIKNRHFQSPLNFTKDFDLIFNIFESKLEPFNKIVFYSIITRILLQVIESSEKIVHHQLSDDIQLVVKHIESNITDSLSIDSLAELTHLSVSRFKAKFKKELGIPPGEFITRKKVETAKLLLSNNESTITEISYQLNFTNSQYFSSVFKKYTQLTPTEFLKSTSK